MLVHNRNSLHLRVLRIPEGHSVAGNSNCTGGGLQCPGDDLDKSRLSRAVLTQERMDGAVCHQEIDAVQNEHALEALGQLPHFKQQRRRSPGRLGRERGGQIRLHQHSLGAYLAVISALKGVQVL